MTDMPALEQYISGTFRKWRGRLGLTQHQVAAGAGIAERYVTSCEGGLGALPGAMVLRKLVAFYVRDRNVTCGEAEELWNWYKELKEEKKRVFAPFDPSICPGDAPTDIARGSSESKRAVPQSSERVNIDVKLQLARQRRTEGRFSEAATHIEAYASEGVMTWEDHFLRGQIYAMLRENSTALAAYNDAVGTAPTDYDKKELARLFAFRGGIFKRLAFLDEAGRPELLGKAENDLDMATRFITSDNGVFDPYIFYDIQYNRACVFALRDAPHDRIKLLQLIESMKGAGIFIREVAAHLDDYFKAYAENEDFLEAIGLQQSGQQQT